VISQARSFDLTCSNTSSLFYPILLQLPFLFKLHAMLSDAAKEGTEDIVSWQPHGMAFRVHNTKEFTETIMQRYFHQTHYKSFQRQLHIYGFLRICSGLDKGSYHHPMFVKGKEMASLRMSRCKVKGPLAKMEVEEPDFYHLAESVGSGVVNVACPDQKHSDYLGLQVGSISAFLLSTGPSGMVSCRSNADPVLSKTVSWPTIQSPQDQHKLRQNASCNNMTPKAQMMILRDEIPAHNMMFGGSTNQTMATMMLQNDFQALPMNTIPQNRRMSLLEEGDEAFFAGKKFFFMEKPFLQPKCPTSNVAIGRLNWTGEGAPAIFVGLALRRRL
jgi:HSF-type DNA-binding